MKKCRQCGGDTGRSNHALYCLPCRDDIDKRSKTAWRNNNKKKLAAYRASVPEETFRFYRIKYKYGLTKDQYNEMLIRQSYRCKACGDDLIQRKPQHIHVDHCHSSGVIRSILCGPCNCCLGLMQESAEKLSRLAKYIRKFK